MHILLVRRRGIVPPFEEPTQAMTPRRRPTPRHRRTAHEPRHAKRRRRFNPDRDVEEWNGAYVPYDIVKEAFVAFLAVAVLIVLLAVVFSSPDEPAITLKTWSVADPVDFAQTAVTELDGTSGTATYGPPYNTTPDASQHIGFFEPEQWFGVHQPIDTAQDFVIGPLRTLPNQPAHPGGAQPLPERLAAAAERVDDRVREGGGQRHRRPAAGCTSPPGATAPSASSSAPSPPWRRPEASTAPC